MSEPDTEKEWEEIRRHLENDLKEGLETVAGVLTKMKDGSASAEDRDAYFLALEDVMVQWFAFVARVFDEYKQPFWSEYGIEYLTLMDMSRAMIGFPLQAVRIMDDYKNSLDAETETSDNDRTDN